MEIERQFLIEKFPELPGIYTAQGSCPDSSNEIHFLYVGESRSRSTA